MKPQAVKELRKRFAFDNWGEYCIFLVIIFGFVFWAFMSRFEGDWVKAIVAILPTLFFFGGLPLLLFVNKRKVDKKWEKAAEEIKKKWVENENKKP